MLSLPDLAWGVGGKVESVRYPRGWAAVAAAINARARGRSRCCRPTPCGGSPGPVAAPVLDPLPRWVRADVLTTGDLTISGTTVPGEGNRAREVQQLLLAGADPAALAAAGVGWLVVESGTPGDMGAAAETLQPLPVPIADAT